MQRMAGLLLALVLVPASLALGQPPRETDLRPVDEAVTVPDFFAFRSRLQSAVARRDAVALVAVLHPGIKLSFGGDSGVEDFHKLWRPGSTDTRLWETLASVLSLGGAFAVDGSFTAPYVFAHWPRTLDAFDHLAVIGTGVRLRKTPSLSGEILASLDFSIVALAEAWDPEAEWVKVGLKDGRTGYIQGRYLRSPLDYRIRFERVDGRWQATLFLAGD